MTSTSESPPQDSSLPQTKRLKTLTLSPNSESQQQYQLDLDNRSNVDCCGICWLSSDADNSIRGYIDCCDHHFCYICILEWAKVESLCPLCKARFNTVTRQPKKGVFRYERIVEVPKRDQVNRLHGNATVGPRDLSDIVCSVCTCKTDDRLLLLCDLCDTACHTYCVDLGCTVPEGDWFCYDCTLANATHYKADQKDNDSDVERVLGDYCGDVSIFDIVSDPKQLEIRNRVTTTLHNCQNVDTRLQLIRENWDGLRNGSLKFSFKSAESSKRKCNDQELRVEASRSSDNVQDKRLHDINRAWKMLDIAKKSVKNIRESPSNVSRSSKQKGAVLSLREAPENPNIAKSQLRVGEMRSTQLGAKNVKSTGVEKQDEYNSPERNKFSKFEKQKHSTSSSERFNVALSTTTGYLDTSLEHNKVQIEREGYKVNGKQLARGTHGSSSSLTNKHCKSSSTMALGTSSPYREDLGLPGFTPCEIDTHIKSRKDIAESKSRTSDEAKAEIQSLVKLNLKPLTRKKRLGIDEFKEVARVCTHTILAACGFEHRKSEARPFRSCVCNHGKEIEQSTLKSNCCVECFHVFVKDIINSVMSERTHQHKLC